MSGTQSKPKPLVKLTKRQSDFFNEKRTLKEIADAFFKGREPNALVFVNAQIKAINLSTDKEWKDNGGYELTGKYEKSYRQRDADKLAAIKLQIKNGAFTPILFKALHSRERKDVSKLLKGVTWCCENCGSEQGNKPPVSGLFFEGDQLVCLDCDHVLLERTPGGQGGPFGYTYKDKKNKPATFAADRIAAQQEEIKQAEIYAELLELVKIMDKDFNGLLSAESIGKWQEGKNIHKRIKAVIKKAK